MGEGSPTFGGRGTKTQSIAMKFGMLVIGLGENAVLVDDLAQRRGVFFGGDTLMERESWLAIKWRAC